MAESKPAVRRRREPPPLRTVRVASVTRLTPAMTRIVFAGEGVESLMPDRPAGSVRLLVPSPGRDDLVIPVWDGNEFLLPDGSRPALRTFTPISVGGSLDSLAIDIVGHEGGIVSQWADRVGPGDSAALSGPGRGYRIDPDADEFLLIGDESAIPAISQLLELLPHRARIGVHLEIRQSDARSDLPRHPGASVDWIVADSGEPPGTGSLAAVRDMPVGVGVRVWAAGEAGAMQAIRRHLFEERGLPRPRAAIRGYWKQR